MRLKEKGFLTSILLLSGLLLSSSVHATLMSRLGGAAAYDDVLDITWLTNAGLSGNDTWADQVAWADNLDTLGFDDWRLATTSDFDCRSGTAADCANTGNELGYMFYHYLNGSLQDNLTGNQMVDGVNLTGIQSLYWSGTEFNPNVASVFGFGSGIQGFGNKGVSLSGWAVRSGDVAAVTVPEPGTLLLMAGGLGLLGFGRRQARRI